METKRGHRWSDDEESFDEKDYECEKRHIKKIKITGDDMTSKQMIANTNSHLPIKIMYAVKEESKRQPEEIESNLLPMNSYLPLKLMSSATVMEDKMKEIRITEIEKFIGEKKISNRPMKSSHLPLEEKRREIERIRGVVKVKSWENKMIENTEERLVRVRGEQSDAYFLDHRTVAEVKYLLKGKTHSQLEVLQCDIMLRMCSGCAHEWEYWNLVLKLIHKYKVKACLKDIHAKLFWKNLQNNIRETNDFEGTGSSSSP